MAGPSSCLHIGTYRNNANRGMGMSYSFLMLNATKSTTYAFSDDLTPGTSLHKLQMNVDIYMYYNNALTTFYYILYPMPDTLQAPSSTCHFKN